MRQTWLFMRPNIGLGVRKIILQGGKIPILDGNGKLVLLNAEGSREPGIGTSAPGAPRAAE